MKHLIFALTLILSNLAFAQSLDMTTTQCVSSLTSPCFQPTQHTDQSLNYTGGRQLSPEANSWAGFSLGFIICAVLAFIVGGALEDAFVPSWYNKK